MRWTGGSVLVAAVKARPRPNPWNQEPGGGPLPSAPPSSPLYRWGDGSTRIEPEPSPPSVVPWIIGGAGAAGAGYYARRAARNWPTPPRPAPPYFPAPPGGAPSAPPRPYVRPVRGGVGSGFPLPPGGRRLRDGTVVFERPAEASGGEPRGVRYIRPRVVVVSRETGEVSPPGWRPGMPAPPVVPGVVPVRARARRLVLDLAGALLRRASPVIPPFLVEGPMPGTGPGTRVPDPLREF